MSKRQEFAEVFGEYEFKLKRRGFLKQGLPNAQADWDMFARALGQDFFDHVCDTGIAPTLIAAPPGKLMRDLGWNRAGRPLGTTQELFVLGVCRVRNSLVHGEKYRVDGDQAVRDEVLVCEALAVLEAAKDRLATAGPGAGTAN